ncbi:MAG: ABC transporter substrate-binding protein [Thermoanaerobaculia bacterium]
MKELDLPLLCVRRTALVLILLLLQCLSLDAKVPQPPVGIGPALRVGVGIQPDTLEISQVTNATVASLLEHVVETLVTVDETGKIAPRLANRWQISPDGLTYTFFLRPGVTFQDGTPLTAQTVIWNVNRLQARVAQVTSCPVAVELAALQSVTALDTTTVRYQLSRPLPNFLATVSWVAWGILSPQSVNLPGNKLFDIQHPVGTGPYTFDSLTTDQLQLNRFDGYRGERPYFSQLAFKFISSTQEREVGLANGQLDVITLPSAKQITILSRDSRYQVFGRPSLRTIFVNLNNQKAPFNDVRVRQAANLAIDRQALIDQVLPGAATVMNAPVAPGVFGYCPSGGPFFYDPAAARKLLTSARIASGMPLRMLTPRGRYLEDEAVAQKIAGYLRDVGFDVTVEALEWPNLMSELSRPPQLVTADLHLFGWAPTFPDAGWQLPQLYDSKKWPPFGPASSFYKNPAVDQLLDAAGQEVNPNTRNSLFCEAQQRIWADVPVVFLWVQNYYLASKAGLTNVVFLPNEKISVAFARPVTPVFQ